MVVKREIFVVERVFVSFYHKNIFIKFLTTPDMRNLKKKNFGGRTIFYGVLTGNYCGRTVDPVYLVNVLNIQCFLDSEA